MELEKKPHEICAQNELQNLKRYTIIVERFAEQERQGVTV